MPFGKPWTDTLSVNQMTQESAEGIAAGTELTPQVAQGTLPASGGQLVDPAANVGDVVTLINPATGEVGFAPAAGGGGLGTPGFSGTTTIAPPGSSTPTVLTLNHNQNAYPVLVLVYMTLNSGEKKQISDLYSDGGQTFGYALGNLNTGLNNTLNTYHVAVYRFGDGESETPNPTTITVDLYF